MPRETRKVVKVNYKPVQKKNGKWTTRKDKTVKKTVVRNKGGKTELERVLAQTPEKKRTEVIKEWRKQDTRRIVGGGMETAAFGTANMLSSKQSENAANYNNVSNMQQNINGGIQSTKNNRDDDEGYDYPGLN